MNIHREIFINNEDDWFKYFSPAGGKKQWKPGYSALEFARAVTNNDFEKEIAESLNLPNLKLDETKLYPEKLTRFDDDWHGPRHHDLACIAKVDNEDIAVCFEAKVKESLDSKLSMYDGESKGKKKRIDWLCKNFFGTEYRDKNRDEYKDIYYQILTGLAGTIAFAAQNDVRKCYFVIYQMIPDSFDPTQDKDSMTNAVNEHIAALNNFLKLYKDKSVKDRFDGKSKVIHLGDIKMDLGDDSYSADTYIAYCQKIFSVEKNK